MRTAPSPGEVLTRITDELAQVFDALEPLAAILVDFVDAAPYAGREDVTPLREVVLGVLDRHRGLVSGAGVVAAPDVFSQCRFWLQWWWTRPSGTPEALRVNLDPAAPDFFDYASADWYLTPMRTSTGHVAGPYVDYACTNEYSLTVATPVRLRGRFVGVAAADVLVSSLERRVVPALRSLDRPMLLVNSSGRVIASASARFAPGLRVPPRDRHVPARTGTARPAIDWRLIPEPDGH